ncbi:uncharacterized protein LOC100205121 isoform X10 [Hydra vulgaris]|uniref:Uncharacterized protein LOC100205121 isoform X10 n=1 Tax=Hydra vulgaris TaxID=6087 RepID=A0ABM4BKY0_HYDVU
MTSNQDTILEEEIQNDEPTQSSFKSRLSNVIRRSKRFIKRESIIEKENEPTNLEYSTNVSHSTQKDPGAIGNGRKISQTVFSQEQQILIDGKAIKQVEVIGEKSPEPMDSKKNRKLSRKKSTDNVELNIACRNLGTADFEGWLMKKAGGHGLRPLTWKRYWCVVKHGNIYCYKTSFDIAADYAIPIKNFSIEDADEKKKVAFRMKPHDEVTKPVIFAGENEAEIKKWVEKLNLVISGIDISENKVDNAIPDYEDRKRVYSTSHQKDVKRHGALSFSSETTGMPGGVSTRTSSTSNPRARLSSNSSKPETCLAVGSMFSSIADIEVDTPTKDVPLNEIFPQVAVEVNEAEMKKKADLERLNAEIAKLNADMLVLNSNGELKSLSLPSKPPEYKVETKVESAAEKLIESKESPEESKTASVNKIIESKESPEEFKAASVDKMLSSSNFVDEDTINIVIKDEDKHEIHNILTNLVENEKQLVFEINTDKPLAGEEITNFLPENAETGEKKTDLLDYAKDKEANSNLLNNSDFEEITNTIEDSKTEEVKVVMIEENYIDDKNSISDDAKSVEITTVLIEGKKTEESANALIHYTETEKRTSELSESGKTEAIVIDMTEDKKVDELTNVMLEEFQIKEISSVLDKQVEELNSVLDKQVDELNSVLKKQVEELKNLLIEENKEICNSLVGVSSSAIDNEKFSSTDLNTSETISSADMHVSETVVISEQIFPELYDKLNNDMVLPPITDYCETIKATIENQNLDLKEKNSSETSNTLQVHLDSSDLFNATCSEETVEDEKNSNVYQSDDIANPLLPEACSDMNKLVDENDNQNIDTQSEVIEYSNRLNESGEESVAVVKVLIEQALSKSEEFCTSEEVTPVPISLMQNTPDNKHSFFEFVEAENLPLLDDGNTMDTIHSIAKDVEPKISKDKRDTDSSSDEDEKDIISNENKDLAKSYDQDEKPLTSLLSSYENNKRALSLNLGDDLEIPAFIDTSLSDDIAIQLITSSPNKSESLGYFTSVETSS